MGLGYWSAPDKLVRLQSTKLKPMVFAFVAALLFKLPVAAHMSRAPRKTKKFKPKKLLLFGATNKVKQKVTIAALALQYGQAL